MVNEIYVEFDGGDGSTLVIDEDTTPLEVAEAFENLASFIRRCVAQCPNKKLSYVDYDEGKLFVGYQGDVVARIFG